MILQMGAEPTEMLKASLRNRNAARQQAQPGPRPQAKHQKNTPASQRGRKGKVSQGQPPRQPLSAESAMVAATWGKYVENVGELDKQLLLQPIQNGTSLHPHPGLFIKEVYQPTSLVDGKRMGDHGKVIQQVPILSGQEAVAAAMKTPPVLIPELLSDLSLDTGTRVNGQKALPPIPQSRGSSETASDGPGETNSSTQQQLVVHQPNGSQLNGNTNSNANGIHLIDTSLIETHSSLLSHETMPALAVQQSTLPIRPAPGCPVPNAMSVTQHCLGLEVQQQQQPRRLPPGLVSVSMPMSMPPPGVVVDGQSQRRLAPGLSIPVVMPQSRVAVPQHGVVLGDEQEQQRQRLPPGLPVPVAVPQPGFVLDEEVVEVPQQQQQHKETGTGGEDGGKEEEWLIEF